MLADWAIIITAVVVLIVLWKFMEYVLDLFAKARALSAEDSSSDKEKGSFSLWQ